MDNPDLNETLAQVWYEDVFKLKGETDVQTAVKLTVDYTNRLYPFIYSDELGWKPSQAFQALPPGEAREKRVKMIKAALRYGNKEVVEMEK